MNTVAMMSSFALLAIFSLAVSAAESSGDEGQKRGALTAKEVMDKTAAIYQDNKLEKAQKVEQMHALLSGLTDEMRVQLNIHKIALTNLRGEIQERVDNPSKFYGTPPANAQQTRGETIRQKRDTCWALSNWHLDCGSSCCCHWFGGCCSSLCGQK